MGKTPVTVGRRGDKSYTLGGGSCQGSPVPASPPDRRKLKRHRVDFLKLFVGERVALAPAFICPRILLVRTHDIVEPWPLRRPRVMLKMNGF